MDHIDNQSECAGNSTKSLMLLTRYVCDTPRHVTPDTLYTFEPVTFQDFVEMVYDNTCRNLHVCRVALCRKYNKRICERKYSMPVSELYAYSYMMRI